MYVFLGRVAAHFLHSEGNIHITVGLALYLDRHIGQAHILLDDHGRILHAYCYVSSRVPRVIVAGAGTEEGDHSQQH